MNDEEVLRKRSPERQYIMRDDDKLMTVKEHRLDLSSRLIGDATQQIWTAWGLGADPINKEDDELTNDFRKLWIDAHVLYNELRRRIEDLHKTDEEEEEDE